MNAEKYVSHIVRKLKCSGQKRTEIRKQILSDISIRMQGGETLEQIIDNMGTPEEIADEFNRNLSEKEQKAYQKGRKTKIITAIGIVLVMLAVYVWWLFPKISEIGSSGNFTQEVLEEKVEKVILLLNQNDFDTLKLDATEAMQSVLNQEAIDNARAAIGDDWGEMQAIGTIYAQEIRQQGGWYAVTQVNVIYSNVDVIYTISFDENVKLAGFYLK